MKKQARAYHVGNLEQQLLDAAFQIARKGGPEVLRLRAIARAVGVSGTAVYRHYPSQEALFLAVKQKVAVDLAASMRRRLDKIANDPASPQETSLIKLRAICIGYIDYALQEPGYSAGFNCRPTS